MLPNATTPCRAVQCFGVLNKCNSLFELLFSSLFLRSVLFRFERNSNATTINNVTNKTDRLRQRSREKTHNWWTQSGGGEVKSAASIYREVSISFRLFSSKCRYIYAHTHTHTIMYTNYEFVKAFVFCTSDRPSVNDSYKFICIYVRLYVYMYAIGYFGVYKYSTK